MLDDSGSRDGRGWVGRARKGLVAGARRGWVAGVGWGLVGGIRWVWRRVGRTRWGLAGVNWRFVGRRWIGSPRGKRRGYKRKERTSMN